MSIEGATLRIEAIGDKWSLKVADLNREQLTELLVKLGIPLELTTPGQGTVADGIKFGLSLPAESATGREGNGK